MSRVLGLALLSLLVAGPASADWTIAHRVEVPISGAPVDLALYAGPSEDPVRVELSGTFSFLMDGSEIDALSATRSGVRDVASGPFVTFPPGTRVLREEPALHRYTLEIPRTDAMPVALNVMSLSMRHLVTTDEVRANLTGNIQIAHLVPPPPPPGVAERSVATVAQRTSAIPVGAWLVGLGGLLSLCALGFVIVRRRKERVSVLLRRAHRASVAVSTEAAMLGPAFDPVAASARRLLEAAVQHGAHHRSLESALQRTAWTSSEDAKTNRADLERQRDQVVSKLTDLVARLEGTATQLAGRAAETVRARGVESLLEDLGADLDAAVEAEEELARV